MPTDFVKKLLDYLLKTLAGLLVAGSSASALDGKWFGQAIFNSYLKRWPGVELIGDPTLPLYSRWGYDSFSKSLSSVGPLTLLLSLLVAAGLLAHILFKPTLLKALADASLSRLKRAYLRSYHAVTLAMFFSLLLLYMSWPRASGLIVLLILIVIPAGGYLVLYSSDMTKGEFVDRFVYSCVFLFLIVTILEWPNQYGSRLFEPRIEAVTLSADSSSAGSCSAQKLKIGPVFLASESAATPVKTLLRVCFDGRGALYLDVFPYDKRVEVGGKEFLSQIIMNFQRPIDAAAAQRAVADVQSQVTALIPR